MYEQLNEKLFQYQQEVHRLRKIETMITSLYNDLLILKEKVASAKANLEKENREYEKINEKGIVSLFYSILGKLDERTEKERREALNAQLKYDQCVRDLEGVRNHIAELESEKLPYKKAQFEYEKLYHEKYKRLIATHDERAQTIMELDQRMEQSKSSQRDIAEAINAGLEVQDCLSRAMESLNDAEDWGVWDMFGGGLVTDMVKHSNIDDASMAAQQAQALLRRFRTELTDVHISDEIEIDISGFSKFADFFFDGLIADWFMQNKINATQDSVQNIQIQVQSVMRKLGELDNAEQNVQKNLTEQIEKLIIEAN